jgi:hypothetical protein
MQMFMMARAFLQYLGANWIPLCHWMFLLRLDFSHAR